MTVRILGCLGCIMILAGAEDVARWEQFRGPGGAGVGAEKADFPSVFGPGKAQRWKIDLPLGHGSPSIWGERIFVTGFDEAAKKLEVIAVNRKDGTIAWRREVKAAGLESVHRISSPATSTPVIDGERVYVYFGSHGVSAFDWNGKPVWEYVMEVGKAPYGSGNSPLLAGELLIVTRDYLPAPKMYALNRKTGALAWQVDLVANRGAGHGSAHATPVLWNNQVLLTRAWEVSAHSLQDGKRIWWVKTGGGGASTLAATADALYVGVYSMMADAGGEVEQVPFSTALEKYDKDKDGKLSAAEVPANDLYFRRRAGVPDDVPGAHFTVKLFFNMIDANKDGGVDENEYNSVWTFIKTMTPVGADGLLRIRPGGEGDQTLTAVQWSERRNVPEVPSPLVYRDRVYMIGNGGIVSCVDRQKGKVVYRGRVNAPGAYYASPVAAGGRVVVASSEGVVTVLGGGDSLEVLANNDLGEAVFGTPAVVGSTIYVRSERHLWAFGEQ